MSTRSLAVIFSIVILSSATAGGFSAEKFKIAVLAFQANNTEPSYGRIICNEMEVALFRTSYFNLIERKQIDLVISEQGFQQSGLTEASSAVEIGKLLSADFVVTGSIDRMNNFIITLKAIDTRKGSVAFADTVRVLSEDKIQESLDVLAKNMAEGIYTKKGLLVINSDQYRYKKKINGSLALGTGILGLTSFGIGIYSNSVVDDANDSYSRFADQYRSATIPADVIRLERSMKTEKDRADEYILYRNICYGIGGAAILVSSYFLYRYITTPEPVEPEISYEKCINIPSIFVILPSRARPYGLSDRFYGAGLCWNF